MLHTSCYIFEVICISDLTKVEPSFEFKSRSIAEALVMMYPHRRGGGHVKKLLDTTYAEISKCRLPRALYHRNTVSSRLLHRKSNDGWYRKCIL